jgi:hypothetical protein
MQTLCAGIDKQIERSFQYGGDAATASTVLLPIPVSEAIVAEYRRAGWTRIAYANTSDQREGSFTQFTFYR